MCVENEKTLKFYTEKGKRKEKSYALTPRGLLFGRGPPGGAPGVREPVGRPAGAAGTGEARPGHRRWVWKQPQPSRAAAHSRLEFSGGRNTMIKLSEQDSAQGSPLLGSFLPTLCLEGPPVPRLCAWADLWAPPLQPGLALQGRARSIPAASAPLGRGLPHPHPPHPALARELQAITA